MPPISCTSKWRICIGAPAGLAHYGEGWPPAEFRPTLRAPQALMASALSDADASAQCARETLPSLPAQLVVGELLRLGFERVDGGDQRHHALDGAIVCGAEDFREGLIEKHGVTLHLQVERRSKLTMRNVRSTEKDVLRLAKLRCLRRSEREEQRRRRTLEEGGKCGSRRSDSKR